MPSRQAQEDRRRLRQSNSRIFEDRNLAHLVDRFSPFGGSRHASTKVGPDRIERLSAQRKHEREFVAVAGFWKIVKAVDGHCLIPLLAAFWNKADILFALPNATAIAHITGR